MVELSDERLDELKTSIPKEIGKRVRFLEKKGLTQTKLAQLVGKDRQNLYIIEKGVVTPYVASISVLAITLEVPLSEFLNIKI